MASSGRDALIVALITGAFGTLSVLVKKVNNWMSLAIFIGTVALSYYIIWRSITRIKASIGRPETHTVFFTIDYGLKVAIDLLPVQNEKKKKLVTLFLKIKFQLLRDALTQAIEDNNLKGLPASISQVLSQTRIKLSERAPAIFVQKIMEWDNKYASWPLEAINNIINSEYYGDNSIKFAACFDCVQVMCRSTYIAVENMIKELNGALEEALELMEDI